MKDNQRRMDEAEFSAFLEWKVPYHPEVPRTVELFPDNETQVLGSSVHIDALGAEWVRREVAAYCCHTRTSNEDLPGWVWAALECGQILGLLREVGDCGEVREIVSTPRLTNCWSKMFWGETPPTSA
jgi:hypothetical protein